MTLDDRNLGIEEIWLRHMAQTHSAPIPHEPTEHMLLAGMRASVAGLPSMEDSSYVRSIYRAMVSTAHTGASGQSSQYALA